jgi:YD repeat-containing protein
MEVHTSRFPSRPRPERASVSDGEAEHVRYDDAGNSSTIEYANGLHRISTFDATGRLISITETNAAETQILGETRYAYGATGRLRAVQNPNGVIVHTLYDAAGRISAVIDGSGALTENIYDANGNIIRTIQYATAVSSTNLNSLVDLDNDELVSVNEVALATIRPSTTADDRINHNVYDTAGKLRISIDAQGYVTEYRYDGTGALIETVAHGTAFPGLGGATTIPANDPVAVDWSNVQTIHNPDGSITLIVSGLENGQQVRIRQFIPTLYA